MRLNVCFETKKSEPLLFMDFVTLSLTLIIITLWVGRRILEIS